MAKGGLEHRKEDREWKERNMMVILIIGKGGVEGKKFK